MVKVVFTKEVLKMPKWVLAAVCERSTAARVGMTGKITTGSKVRKIGEGFFTVDSSRHQVQ